MVDKNRLEILYERILHCKYFENPNGCIKLKNVTDFEYKHGPEISFIGKRYGENNLPKILFSRLNNSWQSDFGWFGTQESINHYRKENPKIPFEDIISNFWTWKSRDCKEYRGFDQMATITGWNNKSTQKKESQHLNSYKYGIFFILKELEKRNIIPCTNEYPFNFCAINNFIKCASNSKNSKPSPSMKQLCKYYEEELEILTPDILFSMGKTTQELLHKSQVIEIHKKLNNFWYIIKYNSKPVLNIYIPHASNQSACILWADDQVTKNKNKELFLSNKYNQNFDAHYSDIFNIRKEGLIKEENKYLFNYLMNCIWEVQNYFRSKRSNI